MAVRDVFLDTSILYALIDRKDAHHSSAREKVGVLLRANRRLVTTDYIVAEGVNLANARAGHYLATRILDLIDRSSGIRTEWIGSLRFEAAKAFFRRYTDHAYSFTDCTSFVVMRELRLTDALSTDGHFREAGFRLLT
jgi:uncharacterized protein